MPARVAYPPTEFDQREVLRIGGQSKSTDSLFAELNEILASANPVVPMFQPVQSFAAPMFQSVQAIAPMIQSVQQSNPSTPHDRAACAAELQQCLTHPSLNWDKSQKLMTVIRCLHLADDKLEAMRRGCPREFALIMSIREHSVEKRKQAKQFAATQMFAAF